MLFVRPAGPADIETLLEFANLSGRGFTSLPEDRPTLVDALALSQRSFEREADPQSARYILFLEDSETGLVDGVAAVKGSVGKDRPHFSFRMVTLSQHSNAVGTRFDHQVLLLVNECGACSEVGTLFLRPDRRRNGAGSLLARSRYLLIASAPDRFAPTIMAELRGWFDDQDNSPFWDGIASKFFRLSFEDADRMITLTDGQFIIDLAPHHPIYLELVNGGARDAIGKVHRHGEPALRMLEKEGFSRSGLVDIFDGGPTMTCARDSIATIRNARRLPVRIGEPAEARPLLVTPGSLRDFRVVRAMAQVMEAMLVLPAEAARLLGVSEGDVVTVSE
ncbi:arginine N-succinyltransferase [Novosphingobium sp. PC22D]|uniref:arginine N-succinyltransferase n=1 Tax=Novosphingobium sp. PC22D TaxID=1962403 RepID=UPI000BF144BB|nr:arginine N-succinyltransferase [Novosphingobium sp. PC22D]PEQ14090.1 arginine N-succinyltransferase [Novosphingobium sp. PC22D]